MKNYTSYELLIKPISSFITPFQSDIVFGHIIWAVSELDGEDKASEIIKEVKQKNPPFIISNGFPEGMLPKINNIKNSEIFKELSKSNDINSKPEKIKLMKFMKGQKKKGFVTKEEFEMLRTKPIAAMLSLNKDRTDEDISYAVSRYGVKNTVNRLDGSTIFTDSSGREVSGLYGMTETFYKSNISIYIKLRNDFVKEDLLRYLEHIELTGYGKKKSSGKGRFEIISFEPVAWIDKEIEEANGYIILSNYVPEKNDYTQIIFADISTKRGKVSGGYAAEENVFKKPIVHYLAGAVFESDSPSEIKGKAIEDIHHKKEIIQFMIPFTVEVKL